MANIPQKSTDLTEDALLAIQEALGTAQPERRAAPLTTPAGASESEQATPLAAADLFNEAPQSDTWDPDGTLTRRPANDDRASLGLMLQACTAARRAALCRRQRRRRRLDRRRPRHLPISTAPN